MTGRAAGFCTGNAAAGWTRRGGGWGRGGRGYRHGYQATGLPGWARWGGAQPPAPHADEAASLSQRLAAIEARLAELDGKDSR